MKKFNFYAVVSMICMFFGIGCVGASDDGFLHVTSKEDFEKAQKIRNKQGNPGKKPPAYS